MAARAIIHFRIRSFFARVEQQRLPELAGRPVLVAKSTGTGAVVVSASSEAKDCGASEGMTVRHAQRLCPDAVFVPANYACYERVFEQVLYILSRYSPLLEPQSLDRAFLDVTLSRNLFGSPVRIAREALARIKSEMDLDASAGVAANKLVAEIASFECAPGEVMVVPPREVLKFLFPLPVRRLPGVGEKTEKRLIELGVRTVGQLAQIPEVLLVRQFGLFGRSLCRLARGIDYTQVEAAWPPKAIIIERMFDKELEEPAEVESEILLAAEEAAMKLRMHGEMAEAIALALQEPGGMVPMRCRLKKPASLPEDIFRAAVRLLGAAMRPGMRTVGLKLTLSDLTPGEGVQLALLGEGERRRRLDPVVQAIRERFGERAISYAAMLAAGGRARVLSRLTA